jgi:hypothetical protein
MPAEHHSAGRDPLHRRPALLIAALVAVVATAIGGCDTTAPPSAIPHAFGEPLDAGPKPDDTACQARIRSEQAVAARIRSNLEKAGLKSDPVTVKAAAADPAADVATLGIPLTAAELAAVRTSGFGSDTTMALAMWIQVGAPERFGGLWFDGPAATIAVVNGDPATIALARCLEGTTTTRFVWASVSQVDGEALKDRVGADIAAWRARGVAVNMVDFDETKGVVTVGLSVVTDDLRRLFAETYGPLVQLIVEGPAQAL